jgi:queuine tRNA-ribosyltransferase
MIRFSIQSKIPGKRGRAGIIHTAHGDIPTPAFIPVATKATIKSLTPEQIRDAVGADAILANTYHLYLQPGTEVLEKAGGLGKFMNWSGPTFTDSGGFQAFSLGAAWGKGIGKITGDKRQEIGIGKISNNKSQISKKSQLNNETKEQLDNSDREQQEESNQAQHAAFAQVDDDGVNFKSIIDGSAHRFTPERSIEIQHSIGADIIFTFDECVSPHEPYEKQREAIDRTHAWAERCIVRHKELNATRAPSSSLPTSALFGIVQGGRHEELRKESAHIIGGMDFDGFGIGGSFDKDDIGIAVGWVTDNLPENKPRHLLGIGSEVVDLILGIENGIDTFDCVAPTRIARNGAAYVREVAGSTSGGRINLLNEKFISDFTPIDAQCNCYTCKNYTKAYLAHLFRAKEMLAATLTTIHNLHFIVNLVKEARVAIIEGKWEEFKRKILG